ncbi:MAG: inositol monophosphatase [Thermomicrobiales bacterium]|nr:inositol monophosphatase [Thermomicrobiales bacterium]
MADHYLQHELEIATATAREAGALLLSRLGEVGKVEFKSSLVDPVTSADRDSQALVTKQLHDAFPDDDIFGEESESHERPTDTRRAWIIDPLDGTVNFLHGYPTFAVSIALYAEGRSQLGLLYDPSRDELFHAIDGHGAYLNGAPIHVSNTSTLIAAMVASGFPYDLDARRKVMPLFNWMVQETQGARRGGSAALDLAYVACGRFDAYWEGNLQAWDVAAAALLVQEAGGRLSRYDGAPFDIWAGEVLASNRLIHDAMLHGICQANTQ